MQENRELRLRQSGMDIDYSSLFGAGFLLALVIPVLLTLLSLLILYLIIRGAVRAGLRDHQLWMEKTRPALHRSLAAEYPPSTAPRPGDLT